MGVTLTTYKSWDDPPSRAMFYQSLVEPKSPGEKTGDPSTDPAICTESLGPCTGGSKLIPRE